MSETLEFPVIDKSTWGEGPWPTEPDRIDFVHAGYACFVARHPRLGHWCGYAGVDNSHPFFEREYQTLDPEPNVHGGLTYSRKCEGALCHVPEPGMPEDVWWLGFDCAHAGDLSPAMAARKREWAKGEAPPGASPELEKEIAKLAALYREGHPEFHREEYRALDYVRTQTERLAEQLRAIANGDPLPVCPVEDDA